MQTGYSSTSLAAVLYHETTYLFQHWDERGRRDSFESSTHFTYQCSRFYETTCLRRQ